MTASLVRQDDILVRVSGVTKSYGGRPVLRGVNLDLRVGEIMGLVGANGVGKSTLAAVMAGLTLPDTGSAQVDGRPGGPDRVGIIEQEPTLDPMLTVAGAIFRHARTHGFPGADQSLAARRALIEAGLALEPDERLGDLEESERRLVEVVRLLADPRDLMILDEVGATFNARELEDLRFAARRATGSGRSMLFITHRLDEVLALCDRVAVMRDGEVVDVVHSLAATPASLSEAMFGRVVKLCPRTRAVAQVPLLDVEAMDIGGARPVTFTVHAGEVLGLCGARGSGVNAVVDALTGDGPRPARSVRMGGDEVQISSPRDAVKQRIGVLPGTLEDDSEAYLARNLLMLNETPGGHFDDDVTEMAAVLRMLTDAERDAEHLLKRPHLSLGQRRWAQMRELAAEESRLLVLVEPTQGMDLQAREAFSDLLDDVCARGVAVIMVASDESELYRLCDRWLVIVAGEVVADWGPEEASVDDLGAVTRGGGAVSTR